MSTHYTLRELFNLTEEDTNLTNDIIEDIIRDKTTTPAENIKMVLDSLKGKKLNYALFVLGGFIENYMNQLKELEEVNAELKDIIRELQDF